jgi:preprotein translocase subunit YajC|nr:MAG TPA: Preprotein translocase subunit [Caudoviricetes sp.]
MALILHIIIGFGIMIVIFSAQDQNDRQKKRRNDLQNRLKEGQKEFSMFDIRNCKNF